MADDDRRRDAGGNHRLVDRHDDRQEPALAQRRRAAVTREVERDRAILLGERAEERIPHPPVEGEAVQEDQRGAQGIRTALGAACQTGPSDPLGERRRNGAVINAIRHGSAPLRFRYNVTLPCIGTPFRYHSPGRTTDLHDAHTADALLDTAERIVEAEGIEALTVRRVAEELGTTTRAVYSSFGSKDALVAALGRQRSSCSATRSTLCRRRPTRPPTSSKRVSSSSPLRDRASVAVPDRRPGALPDLVVTAGDRDTATDALARLTARVERLEAAHLLGGRDTREAVLAFHALCEGLAAVELRGLLPAGREEHVWRDALTALVHGFALPEATRR